MSSRVPVRETTLWIGVVLLVTSSAAIAEDVSPPHVPGEVLCKLAPEAAGSVSGSDPVAWLAPFGVTRIEPALRLVRKGALRVARKRGLDRLYLLEVPDEADVEALSRRLNALPEVEYAHPNYLGEGGGAISPDDTFYPSQWNLENSGQTGGTVDADIDADEAWSIAVGRRETLISVLDSGADGDHIDLRSRMVAGGYDFVGEDFDPEADHPHGTWCSGVIGAVANNGFALTGVDWRSGLHQIKVLNSSNGGTTTDLIQGILHAAGQGIHVASQSLINYPATAGLGDAVLAAYESGLIQIGCHGNSGTGSLSYPAAFPEQVAVGWTTHTDDRSPGSNFTSLLDVVAPGSSVPSLTWGTDTDTFDSVFGCSFATPHVAGLTGLLLAVDPTLTHDQVAAILRTTADDQVGNPSEDVPGRDDFFGWGRVNARAALESLGVASSGWIHVDEIELRRTDTQTLTVGVTVLDELTGLEPDVTVLGSLTLPDLSTVPLDGTTSAIGVASMTYEPGGALPAGAYTYTVDDLQAADRIYDPAADYRSARTHDPGLNGVHVHAIESFDDFSDLTVDVQVFDDDELPEGGVTVRLRVTPPVGSPVIMLEDSRYAVGGVARVTITPALVGTYTIEVLSLTKSGYVYESLRNEVSSATPEVLDPLGDLDLDSVNNQTDDCPAVANVQSDADGDSVGDVCDVCPARADPAQRDRDADGVGDRCDCAPYDPAQTGVAGVQGLVFDADKQTLRWNTVPRADFYDVSRGPLSVLDGTDYGSCQDEDVVGTQWIDAGVPATGEGYFYLIRADDAGCGAGSSGLYGMMQERVNGNAAACVSAD